ncbi:hypothetical protein EVAR_11668_1 [Eumeta japonica]|uniref:Uncharacterized protein n=1 Tax=Eumeta variegata TaxID=151549 RepID=A0A4C1U4F8_EUMVA|nr:hypothetical protein EVAR_11668_1 [Eumeta japonica]
MNPQAPRLSGLPKIDIESELVNPLHRVRPDGTCECRRRVTCAMDDAWWKSSRHRMSQETVTGRFLPARPEAVSGGRVE